MFAQKTTIYGIAMQSTHADKLSVLYVRRGKNTPVHPAGGRDHS
jgi:hypothetical protein